MTLALSVTILAIILLIFLVVRFGMHAFPALLIATFFAAIASGMSVADMMETIKTGMGGTLGFIAVVIGLGCLYGALLEISGGVQAIATALLNKFRAEKSGTAMGVVGLIIAIPVFFDVALILLLPLVNTLAKKAKKPALFFGLPLLAGLATAHAFIPPTPGPVAVAELIGADLGLVMMLGLATGLPAMMIAGPVLTKFLDQRALLGAPLSEDAGDVGDQISAQAASPVPALMVIAIPVFLIVAATITKGMNGPVFALLQAVGHPFAALLIGCGAAWILAYRAGAADMGPFIAKSLEPAGAVILVTGAGGAFKQMLVDTGAGADLAQSAVSLGLTPIIAGFLLALLVRIAQGSATVAMITAAGLMAPIVELSNLPDVQTALVVISIAAGSTAFSHVNDSGFWLVNRFFKQPVDMTLKSWTVCSATVGFAGFAVALILSLIL